MPGKVIKEGPYKLGQGLYLGQLEDAGGEGTTAVGTPAQLVGKATRLGGVPDGTVGLGATHGKATRLGGASDKWPTQ